MTAPGFNQRATPPGRKAGRLGLLLLLAALASGCGGDVDVVGDSPVSVVDERSELDGLNREIAFYQRRVADDSTGGLDLARLAGLCLARARVTGNHEDYRRAGELAARSLERLPVRNGRARLLLASSHLGLHRFYEAAVEARALCREEPGEPAFAGLLAEIELELGHAEAADSLFTILERTPEARTRLDLMVRLARWDEMRGRLDAAQERLDVAEERARFEYGLTPEQRAWFAFKSGEVALRRGRLDRAERSFRRALARRPDDRRLLTGLCQVATRRGDLRAAVAFGERAVAGIPDPAAVVALARALEAAGESARAESLLEPLRRGALQAPFDRIGATLLIESRERLPEVVARLEQEARLRPDQQGLELLARARRAAGRAPEVDEAAPIAPRAASPASPTAVGSSPPSPRAPDPARTGPSR